MAYPYTLPDLEDRFLPSKNWEVGDFINPETNHKIHYSYTPTQNPVGTIICVTGLSEFSEKYIETAKFFNNNNYNFYVMDWAYQGRSSRYKKRPHKRYSDGYKSDVSDLNYFITNIIKTNTPLYMLGHSMGGHIGLRYLATQQHGIKAASFTAPMLGIKNLKYFSSCLQFLLVPFNKYYLPGGTDWKKSSRSSDGTGIFSSDLIRDQVHNKWCLKNLELQVGSPTFKWLCESLKSIRFLRREVVLEGIKIPVLMAYADKETLIDNKKIINAASKIKNAHLLKLNNSKHEILMEEDSIRDKFLNKTLELFNQSA